MVFNSALAAKDCQSESRKLDVYDHRMRKNSIVSNKQEARVYDPDESSSSVFNSSNEKPLSASDSGSHHSDKMKRIVVGAVEAETDSAKQRRIDSAMKQEGPTTWQMKNWQSQERRDLSL